jgi:Splicing factor SF3a60 binding domain
MDSILEIQRQNHEELERFDKALYTLLSRNSTTHETDLQNQHKAAEVLNRIVGRATTLDALYQDEDARRIEVESLSGQGAQGDLSEFYARLVKVQEHYSKYPDSLSGGGFDLELAYFVDEPGQEEEDFEEEDRELLSSSSFQLSDSNLTSNRSAVLWGRVVWPLPRPLQQSYSIHQSERDGEATFISSIPRPTISCPKWDDTR